MEKESNQNMIIGRTGCGMSFHQTREMLMQQGNIAIIDPKGEFGLNGLKGQTENCCPIGNTGKDD